MEDHLVFIKSWWNMNFSYRWTSDRLLVNWKGKQKIMFHAVVPPFNAAILNYKSSRDRRCLDRIEVGFAITCIISAYHHWRFEFKSRWWRGVLDTNLCDKVCQWQVLCLVNSFNHTLALFEQTHCIDWIYCCYLQSLTEIMHPWYPCHMLPVELWEHSCKSR